MVEHFPDTDVQRSVQIDLEMIRYYRKEIAVLDKHILINVKNHDPDAHHILRTYCGIGPILSLIYFTRFLISGGFHVFKTLPHVPAW